MSRWLVDKATRILDRRTSRRDFLGASALVGTAIVASPWQYMSRKISPYEAICGCLGHDCPCNALCCSDGYTEPCCTINDGVNACPSGTVAAGWWKADGSIYCDGPRYYLDCVAQCHCTDGCINTHFCPTCDDIPPCDCANGDCNNRRTGCRTFRYGQCHQELACVGRLSCRVITCTPPWLIDESCTTHVLVDNRTANHTAACLDHPPPAPVVAMAAAPDGKGYWLVAGNGAVSAYGSASFRGSADALDLNKPIVGMAPDAATGGYWLVASDGGIFAFDAPYDGSTGDIELNKPIVGMAADPDGQGYWLVARDGGVFSFDAPFDGSTGYLDLNKPIVGMCATPKGDGYWLVASDGGVFAFGRAGFYGSTGDIELSKPIVAMACTPTGKGYWLAASDGGIFAFGDAGFYGSLGETKLNRPIVGMAAAADGKGYWLVGSDGGVFAFGSADFYGSRL